MYPKKNHAASAARGKGGSANEHLTTSPGLSSSGGTNYAKAGANVVGSRLANRTMGGGGKSKMSRGKGAFGY